MNRFILLLSLVALIACGPSAEEKARLQKAREDSIRVATENTTRIRIETKLALEQKINDAESIKEGQENRLSVLKADLEVQKDRLNTIKLPRLLRTPQEREEAIKTQVLVIGQAEKEILILSEDITKTEEIIINLKSELKKLD